MLFKSICVAAAISVVAGAACATEFRIQWSGVQFGNGATGIGLFDIDTTVAPDIGTQTSHTLPDPAFQILDVTISGARSGNGVFGSADFASYYFASPSTLNYGVQLIGQRLTNGYTFGSFGPGYPDTGDFNLFGTGSAPYGTFYFVLTTDGGVGDSLGVTSIAPISAIPEPAGWALMLVGFTGLGAALRRRRHAASAV